MHTNLSQDRPPGLGIYLYNFIEIIIMIKTTVLTAELPLTVLSTHRVCSVEL